MAAVNFFKPERSWLDSIWFVVPVDFRFAGPDPLDLLTLGGIAKYQLDAGPRPTTAHWHDGDGDVIADRCVPSDCIRSMTVTFDIAGSRYDVNEPEVADSALVMNGAAILHGG